jgi:RNA polymerase sigma-70 factor (ECF subfamily)
MSDAELVQQVLAGRSEAYAELVRRWTGRVAALCHARTGRADVADDLARETLARGLRDLGSLDAPANFGRWLCGLARAVCLDYLQVSGNGRASPPAPSGSPAGAGGEDHRLLAEIEALPEAFREVVLLHYYQDLRYQDLAELLDIAPATVQARLARARALLRERRAGPTGPGPA